MSQPHKEYQAKTTGIDRLRRSVGMSKRRINKSPSATKDAWNVYLPHSAAEEAVREVDNLHNYIKNLKTLGNILSQHLIALPEGQIHEQVKWDLKYWTDLCNQKHP